MSATRALRALAPLRIHASKTQFKTSLQLQKILCRDFSVDLTPQNASSLPAPRPSNFRSQLDSKNPVADPDAPPPPPPKKPLLSGRTIVYITLFSVLGFTLGKYSSMLLAPAALPIPLSKEDLHHINLLKQASLAFPMIAKMMKDPEWESWDAYESLPKDRVDHRLTTGPLGGYQGIGHQRVFHNRRTGEYVVLVWLGKGLAGWPGVVHGGCIATVLDECLGRAALAGFEGGSGVTAQLDIEYKKPVVSGEWWIVRTKVDDPENKDRHRKTWVTGTLEDLEGKIHVKTKGLFVVPKGIKLKSVGGRF